MGFKFDSNHYSYLCVNPKRCFLILLLFNSFLACIYYIHEKDFLLISSNITTHTQQIDTNINQNQNRALTFIRNILENEYNQDDLIKFYNIVEEQFSLGLRCTRKTSPLPTIILSNTSNLTSSEETNRSNTTIR
jgi:hypothetical protein